MSSLPSPAFAFLPNAPGAKYQAAASTPIVATLNNLASVSNTTWRVISVDDLTFTALGGNLSTYALTISGPKNSVCTLTSAPAGTAGFLEATINGGINPLTGNIDPVMTYHVKWWVSATNGSEVVCFNEQLESGPQGYLPLLNIAIRNLPTGVVASVGGVSPIASTGGATPQISILPASGSTAGSLSTAFFSKLNAATSSPTSNTLSIRGSSGELLSAWVAPDVAANVASGGFVKTSGSAQAIVSSKSIVTPTHDVDVIAIDGSDNILIGDSTDTVGIILSSNGQIVTAPGAAFFVKVSGITIFTADGGNSLIGSKYNFQFFSDVVNPTIGQLPVGGTGVAVGSPLVLGGQSGQQQSGANNNNNGGSVTLRGGSAGTGGSGTTGVQGSVVLQGGGKTATLSATSLLVTCNLDLANHKATGLLDPNAGSQEAATAVYAETVAATAAATKVASVGVTAPVTTTGPATSPTIGINASSVATASYVIQRDSSGNAAVVGLTASTITIPTTASFTLSQAAPATGVAPVDWVLSCQPAHSGDAKDGAGASIAVGVAGDSAHLNGTLTVDLGAANAANIAGKVSLVSGGSEFGSISRSLTTPAFNLSATNKLLISIAGNQIFGSDGSGSSISRDITFIAQGGGNLLRLDPSNTGKVAWFGGSGATKQTVTGSRLSTDSALTSLLSALSAYGKITDSTSVVSSSGLVFALDVVLVGGTKTQASGKDLSNAVVIAVLLKTPSVAVGAPTATISSNNVIVTSFTAGAVQAVTDASTYTVMILGAA